MKAGGVMGQRYDIAVIGTGPAGVSAAITAAVRNKSVLLIGSAGGSDKVSKAHSIRNYPGLPDIPGAELAKRYKEHLDILNVPVMDKRVSMVYAMGDYYSLQIDQNFMEASAVILAAGVSFGKPLPGEDENLGRGVSYCATCDAALYRGKSAAVVSWAEKEEDEARFLAEMADLVTYIPMYKTGEKEDLFPGAENIRTERAVPSGIEKRDGKMVLLTDGGELIADGIFLLRESVQPGKLVPGLELDGNHVRVDRNMKTNLPGLFAAGDVTGAPYQYIKAAGEGNVAALSAAAYLDLLKKAQS